MLLVIFICVYDFLGPSLENKRCDMIEGLYHYYLENKPKQICPL